MDFIRSFSDQKNRVFIVTGANAGLGFETTQMLAAKGAKVVMACRNLKKGKAAKSKILAAQPDADLELMQIDLSSLASVRAFAANYNQKFDRLDVLINNAGVMMPPYSQTEDGFELQLGANYLGHFLLTGLLLPLLQSTNNSRVVTLSSLVHRNGAINFEDLQSAKKYSASDAYGQSKLACLSFTFELQRRLEKAGISTVISNAAHPGIATTELSRHMPKVLYYVLRYTVAPFITHSAKEGAKPTVLAALGKTEGGEYYGPTGFREFKGPPGLATYTDQAADKDLGKRLWEESEKLVNFQYL